MNDVNYKVINIPGKGLGMIATKDISYGELILEEKPMLDSSLGQTLQEQFERLKENEQKGIMSLHNAYPEDGNFTGILKTNCYGRGDTDYIVLYVNMSRMNHSCMPNVMNRFNGVCERAVATRNITKGEELCTSYIMLTDTITDTRNKLRQEWRFDCMCELCTTKNDIERNTIETNRMKYQKLDKTLDCTGIYSPQERLKQVQEIFKAMEMGKLMFPKLIARTAYDGFQAALLCNDRVEAVKYIKQAYEVNLIAEGTESYWTKKLLRFYNNLEQHGLFREW